MDPSAHAQSPEENPPAHAHSAEETLDALETSLDGLGAEEAARRREEYGPNEVASEGQRSLLDIFLTQFRSVLIYVLVVAAALSVWAGHAVDAVLIAVIVVANGLFGFVQDYRAEESLAALRELTAPTAAVRRGGTPTPVEATELVPGDVVELEGGDVVPADCRLVETTGLEIDEAALTGESVPVSKSPAPVDADTPLAERAPMAYKGTNVTRGRAVAVVTGTGDETEVGAIALELAGTEETETPLQTELDSLGRTLGLGVVILAALVVPLLLLQGTEPFQAALTAVSLAVAAVPEGLPAVVTLTLALGVRQMAEENALVRRLPAVEALGGVDVVCTDKTGTLTRGQMTVSRLWVNDGVVAAEDIETDRSAVDETETTGARARERVDLLLRAGALCNDAAGDEGDPTERALVDAAADSGIDVAALRDSHPRTDEIPFSSERKWMGTVHGDRAYVKGAPTVVLSKADRILTEDGPVPLTDERAARVSERVDAFADDALRVLAAAYADDVSDDGEFEDGLVFVGLFGLIDPAREEVADAIAATRRAGIDVKMITGDNVRTAAAIAADLGMDTEVMEGREIDELDEATLRDRVESVDVFARTEPEHKVRILRALQDNGHRVAMTGDGVNDAPALKHADVGVAMGIRGTDVAKQASDIVLLDDNYATIERAIERGRAIFDNVWKFVGYLLSANVAEVAIVFIASLFGYLVLPAVQLLWINLLTDGLPAVALGADPASEDVMDRPPRDPDRGIVGRGMLGLMGGTGAVSTMAMLGLLAVTLGGATAVTPYAMTMVFTGFVAVEFEKLYVIRWLRATPTFSNPWLAAAVTVSAILQLAVLYTPLNRYFGTVPLELGDWLLIGAVVAVCLLGHLAVAVAVRRWQRAER
ncbi:calcium-translocating P-type ATPase, PMCA-type [Halomicroarcula sp. F27]|uniref:P-type Ca(2+) transporter n=1 Tax=Haloarcula nitratireducens TaxID=2487749 RepID=A0AAW4P939_9EURY|nr:calcium-translocating P-type ATPase, PMCA-type [Halomicroarcula nitratireducens]MBX0294576.1 calcium-translocating P-type ATPase, PMCA-type [Halomicroarcula nitratireducens]